MRILSVALIAFSSALAACGGDDGQNPPLGTGGSPSSDGNGATGGTDAVGGTGGTDAVGGTGGTDAVGGMSGMGATGGTGGGDTGGTGGAAVGGEGEPCDIGSVCDAGLFCTDGTCQTPVLMRFCHCMFRGGDAIDIPMELRVGSTVLGPVMSTRCTQCQAFPRTEFPYDAVATDDGQSVTSGTVDLTQVTSDELVFVVDLGGASVFGIPCDENIEPICG